MKLFALAAIVALAAAPALAQSPYQHLPADLAAVHGLTGVLGGADQRLGRTGQLRLHNPAGAVLLEVTWSDAPPWPAAAAGAGASLVLAQPSYGEGDPRAWISQASACWKSASEWKTGRRPASFVMSAGRFRSVVMASVRFAGSRRPSVV